MSDLREPTILCVFAAKGMGKTHTTANNEIAHYITPTPTWKGRKVCIFDTNLEYTDSKLRDKFKVNWRAKPLALKDLAAWTHSPTIEARRILPLDDKNKIVTSVDKKVEILYKILQTFRNGLLVLDDISTYMVNPSSTDVISAIVSNRHKNLEICLHYQNFRTVRPVIWANVGVLRLHNVNERVELVSNKVSNPECLMIAQALVDYKFKTNKRFYLYVNYQEDKIYGAFSLRDFWTACYVYIKENNPKVYSAALKRYGSDAVGEDNAQKYCIKLFQEKYYGN